MRTLQQPQTLEHFAASCLAVRPEDVKLETRALRGGLVSPCVRWVSARADEQKGFGHDRERRERHFIVKQLAGTAEREASIYRALMASPIRGIAPALLAVAPSAEAGVELYIQAIRAADDWPWRHVDNSKAVMRALACLHDVGDQGALARSVGDWDYERELEQRGAALLEALDARRSLLRKLGVDARFSLVQRFVEALPRVRQQLSSDSVLPATVIHGDMHTGNVLLHGPGSGRVPVFLDWARARLGSPLEDVSSWLQSLAFWEPEARRRHDTLLRDYLALRRVSWPVGHEVRGAYWFAAARNCLGGSLQYYLHVLTEPESAPGGHDLAASAVRDQLRVLRRAAACL